MKRGAEEAAAAPAAKRARIDELAETIAALKADLKKLKKEEAEAKKRSRQETLGPIDASLHALIKERYAIAPLPLYYLGGPIWNGHRLYFSESDLRAQNKHTTINPNHIYVAYVQPIDADAPPSTYDGDSSLSSSDSSE